MQSNLASGLHVAIIMDGNGRWATRRGLPRIAGHRAGLGAARRIVERASEVGIRCLTLYAFSSDNWRRPPAEVQTDLLAAASVSAHGDGTHARARCAAAGDRAARSPAEAACCVPSSRLNGPRRGAPQFCFAWPSTIRRAMRSCARRQRRGREPAA